MSKIAAYALDLIQQAYDLPNDQYFVCDGAAIAFRGSEDLDDWLANLAAIKIPYVIPHDSFSIPGGEVHAGFLRRWHNIRASVFAAIGDEPREIRVYGHSLGGSMAAQCAVELSLQHGGWKPKVLTFGAPHVGDAAFVRLVNANISEYIRMEAWGDPVPWIPAYWRGFRHAGKCLQIGGLPKWPLVRNHLMANYMEATRG